MGVPENGKMGVDKRAHSKYTINGSEYTTGFYPILVPMDSTQPAGMRGCREPRNPSIANPEAVA
jgi:hypothetical protein